MSFSSLGLVGPVVLLDGPVVGNGKTIARYCACFYSCAILCVCYLFIEGVLVWNCRLLNVKIKKYLFSVYSRFIPDLFKVYSWFIPDLFRVYSRFIPDLFNIYSWFIPDLFKAYSQFIHGLMNFCLKRRVLQLPRPPKKNAGATCPNWKIIIAQKTARYFYPFLQLLGTVHLMDPSAADDITLDFFSLPKIMILIFTQIEHYFYRSHLSDHWVIPKTKKA